MPLYNDQAYGSTGLHSQTSQYQNYNQPGNNNRKTFEPMLMNQILANDQDFT